MIEFRNVSKTYKSKKKVTTEALKNVSFTLPNTGMVFILGKSGSGKSTLLNILGGLDNCDAGEIYVDSKKISNFKENDYDYYRNTYVGFIFQEFNLIEEYNVYDNISLGLKLQKEKVKKEQLDQILEQVGLTGLGLRKINELSGGQKQRVAIARALIKNPNMILADEPTGSLDSETGKQIFDLLKQISREKLVVIVSHDVESANQYADGIIEIHDGVVVSNTIMLEPASQRAFVTKKSHLPWKDSFHLAVKSLLTKKIKMVVTIILVTMALLFFGVSTSLSSYDFPYTIAKVLLENGEHYIDLEKDTGYMEDFNIHEVEEKLDFSYFPIYHLTSDNLTVSFQTNSREYVSDRENAMAYYAKSIYDISFVEAPASFITGEILGHYPETTDEIMIHSYLVDLFSVNGVLIHSETEPNQQTYYYPESNEELLARNPEIIIGNQTVKVSGIILDDTTPFESLKEQSVYEEVNSQPYFLGLENSNTLTNEFAAKISDHALDVYVKEGFIDDFSLEPNNRIEGSAFSIKIESSNPRVSPFYSNYEYLDESILVDNGTDIQEVSHLNDNEIIINDAFLNSISNNEFNRELADYQRSHGDQSDTEAKTDFVRIYLEENNLLNRDIETEWIAYGAYSGEKIGIRIVGYQNENNVIYIADNLATQYQVKNIEISALRIKVEKESEIKEIIHAFPIDDNHVEYMTTTEMPVSSYNPYFRYFSMVIDAFETLSGLALAISVIFAFFAVILLMNFIITSIFHSKKTIGILRALGAKKTDVMKIFFQEGLLIGIVSCILTGFLLGIVIYFLNQKISSFFFFDVSFILFTPQSMLTLLLGVLIVIFISSLIAVYKISRMKPVDAISNK